jgi:hypothetical protein
LNAEGVIKGGYLEAAAIHDVEGTVAVERLSLNAEGSAPRAKHDEVAAVLDLKGAEAVECLSLNAEGRAHPGYREITTVDDVEGTEAVERLPLEGNAPVLSTMKSPLFSMLRELLPLDVCP